jgi:site-specific recombinase XerD
VLAGSKWKGSKGLHTLWYSVASWLAAAGVDHRTMDDVLTHVSPEIRRRYTHSTPELKSMEVATAFAWDGESML